MNTTLADLIHEAVKTRQEWLHGETTEESEQLALNCLEERLNEIIDARINEAIIKHFAITLP